MMQQYLNFLRHIKEQGTSKTDRTGTGTQSIFGYQMRFNLRLGFPLVTTKKIHIKSLIHELLWFLKGETNNNHLAEHGVRIWNDWSLEDGNLGAIYGKQWRSWQTPDGKVIDQIQEAINLLKTRPSSRRIIVNSWNPSVLPDESISPQENVRNGKAALAPCHMLFQFYVTDGQLSCMLSQRSADAFLGVPFNIASYALLTHMVARECNLDVGDFIWSGGDCHIYSNHQKQINEQLTRDPMPLPTLYIKPTTASIFDYQFSDFNIINYQCHPAIKAQVSV